jgi:hypothetical protein
LDKNSEARYVLSSVSQRGTTAADIIPAYTSAEILALFADDSDPCEFRRSQISSPANQVQFLNDLDQDTCPLIRISLSERIAAIEFLSPEAAI